MHRTQIQIEDWQYEALRARAQSAGCSLSMVIREVLSQALQPSDPRAQRRIEAIEGVGEDPAAYGRDHDAHLYGDRKRS